MKDLEEQIHSLTNKIGPVALLSKLARQILRDIDWTTAQPSRAKIILLATNLISNPVQINKIQKILTDCHSEFYNFMPYRQNTEPYKRCSRKKYILYECNDCDKLHKKLDVEK